MRNTHENCLFYLEMITTYILEYDGFEWIFQSSPAGAKVIVKEGEKLI